MEHLSNEEKAEQIAQYHCANALNLIQAYNAALDMAEWKDEKHEQEKQQLIDKAVEYISIHTLKTMSARDIHNIIVDFKNYMKAE